MRARIDCLAWATTRLLLDIDSVTLYGETAFGIDVDRSSLCLRNSLWVSESSFMSWPLTYCFCPVLTIETLRKTCSVLYSGTMHVLQHSFSVRPCSVSGKDVPAPGRAARNAQAPTTGCTRRRGCRASGAGGTAATGRTRSTAGRTRRAAAPPEPNGGHQQRPARGRRGGARGVGLLGGATVGGAGHRLRRSRTRRCR